MTEELHRAVGRIEGRLDTIIELLKDRNAFDDEASVDKRVAAGGPQSETFPGIFPLRETSFFELGAVRVSIHAWYSGAAEAAVVAVLVKHCPPFLLVICSSAISAAHPEYRAPAFRAWPPVLPRSRRSPRLPKNSAAV